MLWYQTICQNGTPSTRLPAALTSISEPFTDGSSKGFGAGDWVHSWSEVGGTSPALTLSVSFSPPTTFYGMKALADRGSLKRDLAASVSTVDRRVGNELPERRHTDSADIWAAKHKKSRISLAYLSTFSRIGSNEPDRAHPNASRVV